MREGGVRAAVCVALAFVCLSSVDARKHLRLRTEATETEQLNQELAELITLHWGSADKAECTAEEAALQDATDLEISTWQDKSSHYDPAMARTLAVLSGAAYCYEDKRFDLQSWSLYDRCSTDSEIGGYKVLKTYEPKAVAGFAYIGVLEQGNAIVLSVKGTTPSHIADIKLDLASIWSFDEECAVGNNPLNIHTGFCKLFVALKSEGLINDLIDVTKQFPNYSVYATGHSLGGSIASLVGLELMEVHNMPVHAVTFGQPRTGASSFASRYASALNRFPAATYFRVVHHNDVVPHIPVCKPGCDSACKRASTAPYHGGHQIMYGKDMTVDAEFTKCHPADGKDCQAKSILSYSVSEHSWYFSMKLSQWCCPAPSPTPMPEDSESSSSSSEEEEEEEEEVQPEDFSPWWDDNWSSWGKPQRQHGETQAVDEGAIPMVLVLGAVCALSGFAMVAFVGFRARGRRPRIRSLEVLHKPLMA